MKNNTSILTMAAKRKILLEEIISSKKNNIKNAPNGKLHIVPHKKGVQYYIRTDASDKSGKYLKKDNVELAYRIAQREYDELVLESAQKELVVLNRMIDNYPDRNSSFENVYENISYRKKALVKTKYDSDDDYINKWKSQEYERVNYYNDNQIYDNGSGICMRSKSELLISKTLDDMEIPYLYEKPLLLGTKTVIPDFTILDVKNRREIYLEHLGMMDNNEYIRKNLKKIKLYQDNHYYIGDRLLVTYETNNNPIDLNYIRSMLNNFGF
ncbi:MAG: hypothetical protein K6E79_09750 [Pseudobutyrivibrio sp.]|nr:hypothetical protein [Pseudobutyrivibrio sp.]